MYTAYQEAFTCQSPITAHFVPRHSAPTNRRAEFKSLFVIHNFVRELSFCKKYVNPNLIKRKLNLNNLIVKCTKKTYHCQIYYKKPYLGLLNYILVPLTKQQSLMEYIEVGHNVHC